MMGILENIYDYYKRFLVGSNLLYQAEHDEVRFVVIETKLVSV